MLISRQGNCGQSDLPGAACAQNVDWDTPAVFRRGPKVTILIPTFNRPQYLPHALAGALNQTYRNIQVIIINDGGEDVTGIVNACGDPRVILIDRKQNFGKAFSLNEALQRAEGKYIAYLDDDDVFYPHHIELLVDTLENKTGCQVAYSDLYKTYCRIEPSGSRIALSKVLEVSRDFDRFLILYYNNVLHVSLMHRKDLLDKTGPYNENLTVLIDWDMTRRLAFFSDFCHVQQITGEYFYPAGKSDRISQKQRQDRTSYLQNAIRIRTTRPPKPWPKIQDLSLILPADCLTKETAATLGSIWRYTFYPYQLYLPMPAADLDRFHTDMPNIVKVPVTPSASQTERIDAALSICDGDYVTIVPSGFNIGEMWLEDSLYALINSSRQDLAFELEASTETHWAVVLKKADLLRARTGFPNLPLRQSIQAAGIRLTRVAPDQIPFQFDQLLEEARATEKRGNYTRAAEIFEYIGRNCQNTLWMNSLAAQALFRAGHYARAALLVHELNLQRPTVDTLLLEARLKRRTNDTHAAIELLQNAQQIFEGKELIWI